MPPGVNFDGAEYTTFSFCSLYVLVRQLVAYLLTLSLFVAARKAADRDGTSSTRLVAQTVILVLGLAAVAPEVEVLAPRYRTVIPPDVAPLGAHAGRPIRTFDAQLAHDAPRLAARHGRDQRDGCREEHTPGRVRAAPKITFMPQWHVFALTSM
jgi:hypothetical protein